MKRMRDGSYTVPPAFTVRPSDSLSTMLLARADAHPDQVVVEQRTAVGSARPITASELVRQVDDAARGLIGMGVDPGDAVAILAPTCYEWMILDLALASVGAVSVPIYESDSAQQITHILADAHVTLVFTATAQQAELVSLSAPEHCPVHSFDRGAMRLLAKRARQIPVEEAHRRRAQVTSSSTATIIYTSGTTGAPKGVALTHANFVGTCLSARQILGSVIDSPSTRLLLFLPVAHVLARLVMHVVLAGQGVLGFSPSIKNLLPDIQSFKPSVLLVVPRVLEKVYNSASAKAGGGFKGRLFSWAANQARALSRSTSYADTPLPESEVAGPLPDTTTVPDASGTPSPGPSLGLRLRGRLADALVLKKVRAVLGPNLHTIICGGAPLAVDLANFYRGLGVTLLQGYGLSETTGPITVELPHDFPPDSVGFPWPGNRLKLAPDGELLAQGISVTKGYHNLPGATAEAFVDGWFRTGDLASIDDRGHVRITGRKKELIVTAGGKNVSPEVLEESLSTHPLIANIVVVGEGRPYIGALIALDTEMLPDWLRRHGLPVVDAAQAGELPEVRESLERAIARANTRVSRAESIRRYRIVNAAFTVENGYMTPSLKLKRRRVLADYAHEVDALYSSGADASAGGDGAAKD